MAFNLGGSGGGAGAGIGRMELNGDDPEQKRAYKTHFGGVDRYVEDMDREQERLKGVDAGRRAKVEAERRARERARNRAGGCLWFSGAAQAAHFVLGRRIATVLVGDEPGESPQRRPGGGSRSVPVQNVGGLVFTDATQPPGTPLATSAGVFSDGAVSSLRRAARISDASASGRQSPSAELHSGSAASCRASHSSPRSSREAEESAAALPPARQPPRPDGTWECHSARGDSEGEEAKLL